MGHVRLPWIVRGVQAAGFRFRSGLLQAEIAVRLFQHERGRVPSDLNELARDYLTSAPVDAYSQPLV